MVRRIINGRPTWLSMLAIVAALAIAVPAAAQAAGGGIGDRIRSGYSSHRPIAAESATTEA